MTWLPQWRRHFFGKLRVSVYGGVVEEAKRRRSVGPMLELLEDRTTPTTFTLGNNDVSGLSGAIQTANSDGQADTIVLARNGTYTLTTVNNSTAGANGLPVITSTNLTIDGNGATIARSSAAGTPAFRILFIGANASVTLEDVLISGGLAQGSAGANGASGANGSSATASGARRERAKRCERQFRRQRPGRRHLPQRWNACPHRIDRGSQPGRRGARRKRGHRR